MSHPGAAELGELLALCPALAQLRDDALCEQADWLEVPAGTLLFEEQAPCRGFPLVLGGEVRVARGSARGRCARSSPGCCAASTPLANCSPCDRGHRPVRPRRRHSSASRPWWPAEKEQT